jgi:ectoine hydroxylase-related dioxygenase (phytanoyl-CoA dioxygenase family)
VPHAQAPVSLLREMATLRIHLDDSPAENGALRVVPASHRLGKIPAEGISAELEKAAPVVACECFAGDVLLMSPLLLHSSPRAIEPDRRRVIHFEYAPRDQLSPGLRWHESISTAALPQ